MNLQGDFVVSVDPKGRIRLPAALLRQLGGGVEGESDLPVHQFMMNHWFENRLMLWPLATWTEMTGQFRKLNPFNQSHRLFVREFYKGQSPIASDSAGRILINRRLLDYAGITDELVLSCQWNRIEVSSSKDYFAPVDVNLYESLGQTVFGGSADAAVSDSPSIDLGNLFGSTENDPNGDDAILNLFK